MRFKTCFLSLCLTTTDLSINSITASEPILLNLKIFFLRLVPANSAAFPEIYVCLEADVFPQSGVKCVSGPINLNTLIGTPNASAQIWVITVFEP